MFKRSSSPLPMISITVAFLAITAVGSDPNPMNGSDSRKLDEVDQSKCGGCPCGTTCTPIYPSPPPPSVPPPPPPPPKILKPSAGYCPPPPSPPSNFIYVMGPPGNLYPVDQTYNSACRSFAATFPAALGGALLALFMMR